MIFLKRFVYFALSVGSAAVIFLLVAAIVVGVTFLPKESLGNDTKNPSDIGLPTEDASQNTVLLAVFWDGDTVLASKLTAYLNNGTVTAETLKISPQLTETLETNGVLPFLEECFAEFFEGRQKYIVFDGEIFAKITDIYGGLVYNESGMGDVLLTGGQVTSILTAENFSLACKQLGEKMLTKNRVDGFRLLANSTLNNLSYPDFFEKISP